jgi:hypothetical protein
MVYLAQGRDQQRAVMDTGRGHLVPHKRGISTLDRSLSYQEGLCFME